MRNGLKIKYTHIYAVLACLITVFEVPYLKEVVIGYTMLERGLMLLTLVLLLAQAIYKKIRFDKAFCYFICYFTYMFAVTVLRSGAMITYIDKFVLILFFSYIPFLLKRREELNTVLQIWSIMLCILLVVDVLTMILYPNGLYVSDHYSNNWFLGYKTNRLLYTFPLMVFKFVLIFINETKIRARDIFIFLLIILDIYKSGATMGTVVVCFYLVVMMMLYNIRTEDRIQSFLVKRVLSFKSFVVVYGIIFSLVVIGQNNYWIQKIVVEWFSKKADFSGRTPIWIRCLNSIMKRPIFGYGMLSSTRYIEITGGYVNPHNMLLTFLLCGGIVGVVLLLVYIMRVLGKAVYTKECVSLILALYLIFILGITSSTLTYSPYVFCFLTLILVLSGEEKKGRVKNEDK